MSALMKRRPIDPAEDTVGQRRAKKERFVVIQLKGRAGKSKELLTQAVGMGFNVVSIEPASAESESIPWRDAFPNITNEELPGVSLTGARTKEGMTQRELAAATGIPQRHISEMENSKRPIGKERAKTLAKVLNVDYRIFL